MLDKFVRLIKSDDLIETVGLANHITALPLPCLKIICKILGIIKVRTSGIHVEANWHKNKGKGVIGETKFIESLPFNLGTVKLGGIVATADPQTVISRRFYSYTKKLRHVLKRRDS